MTYKQFIEEIRKNLKYEVPEPPKPPKGPRCEKCGNPPHAGKCKKAVRETIYYTIENGWVYKNGSFIALLWSDCCLSPWQLNDRKDKPPETMLLLKWEIGGTRGEGDSSHSYTSDNKEPEWEHLDAILEHFCPSISYLKYKALQRKINKTSYTENGYYGDSTSFSIHLLPLKMLWSFLDDHDLFEPRDA